MVARLGDIADINPKLREAPAPDSLVSFVPMAAVSSDTAQVEAHDERPFAQVSKGYTPFCRGDVLVAKITPCFENGKIAQANLRHRLGFGSTEFHVVRARSETLDARYLLHYLRQDRVRRAGERRMTGSGGQRRVPEAFIADLAVPLPALAEQRRIAEVLDRTELLRAKRLATLAKLVALQEAIFLDLFGDAATNTKGWSSVRLSDVLTRPLRNGLSPSNGGPVTAKVLTLSAVTGDTFNPTAWKIGTFQAPPPSDQSVNAADLLICRGNGNLALVGRGFFPRVSLPEVTYPDTVIAAPINTALIDRAFLEHVWNGSSVRHQIEAVARTTNGTYKVNQTMLQAITVIAPPLSLQREFSKRVACVQRLREVQRRSLSGLESLGASLQHRAFHGEL